MPRTLTPVDAELGKRFRKSRIELGVSLSDLAEAIGMKYQQIQKYERGKVRFAVSTMIRMSVALGMPCDELAQELRALARLLPNLPKPLKRREPKKGKSK